MANEKKYERSIELLNNALAEENTASLQYMYFHFICEDKGYRPLAQYFKRTAIQEMKHAEEFAERILFLEGEVKMVLAKGVKHITEVPEMLDYARELEKGTIEDYNAWSKRAIIEAAMNVRAMRVPTSCSRTSSWWRRGIWTNSVWRWRTRRSTARSTLRCRWWTTSRTRSRETLRLMERRAVFGPPFCV